MPSLRREEHFVAATMAETLGVRVAQHDDGSKPGMHDLEFCTKDGTWAAVEVTAAADADSVELWSLLNGSDQRWSIPGLRGGWLLHLHPRARAKLLRRELPGLLREAEQMAIDEIPRPNLRTRTISALAERAHTLGIVAAAQSGTSFPGSVYFTIDQPGERTGGLVDRSGPAVPTWTAAFLRGDRQQDVLAKLRRSGADERHAVLLLPGFTTAPFGVSDALWGDVEDAVPTDAPALPTPVTHVWLMTTWSIGSGLRWSPNGAWQRFERVFGDGGDKSSN